MPLDVEGFKQHAKDYVERETGQKVLSVNFVKTIEFLGDEDVVLSVVTKGDHENEWWVVGGATLTNLYPKTSLMDAEAAFTLHLGYMMRMEEMNPTISDKPPDDIGYDAFISHASEDKELVAQPLSEELRSMGFWVWYDEFTLEVGDSLRQSIDRGLINSRYGIIILSTAFFQKQWPQYELNGLTSREMEGNKVILPIWHGVTKKDVLSYSPPLADKLAIDTTNLTIKDVALALRKVLSK
jgi:hypothetical protein